jgi:hypothetical protein
MTYAICVSDPVCRTPGVNRRGRLDCQLRAEMLQSIVGVVFKDFQAEAGANIPMRAVSGGHSI